MATKNDSKSNVKAPVNPLDAMTFGDIDGAKRVETGFPAAWVPHYAELSDKDRAEKLDKLPKGSTFRKDMRGRLFVETSFKGGDDERDMYHLFVGEGDNEVRVRLPEHATLWNALAFCDIGDDVKIVYAGRGRASGKTKSGKPKSPPHLYDVTPSKARKVAREDALITSSSDDG